MNCLAGKRQLSAMCYVPGSESGLVLTSHYFQLEYPDCLESKGCTDTLRQVPSAQCNLNLQQGRCTMRSESCCALRHKQICRKCLQIKLNGFRPVQTLMDITSNTFYKCSATFQTSPPMRHHVPSHFNWTLLQPKCTVTFQTHCISV